MATLGHDYLRTCLTKYSEQKGDQKKKKKVTRMLMDNKLNALT